MNDQTDNTNADNAFIASVSRQANGTRAAIERALASYQERLDFFTRPEFHSSLQSAMMGIAKMVEHKPLMRRLLRERAELYNDRVLCEGPEHEEDEGYEEREPTHEIIFHVHTYNKEEQKALYYEIMSFCKDDDAPFCDPNCSVKVAYGTTIVLPLSLDMHDYNFVVKFFVDVPNTVLSFLERKGMVQASPGYASAGSLSIVCPTGN